ncbi:MAG TPA: DUF2723 domain-containing protein [Planctomycetota bacterium]
MKASLRTFSIPCATTFILCLSTLGDRVFWQDSGFFLAAVKELGVLYPPGFVLYELSCWAWTKLFFFVDFTRAVHLYSAACASAAAGVLAWAALDLLRARSRAFAVLTDAGPHAEACAAVAGCLAGAGYTFWASGIMAKGYALYYLILALLLWRMIVAAERKRTGDFTAVAVLIGLAWASHPSATLGGLALLGFAVYGARILGWKGMAWRTGLAAFAAALPTLLTPLLARRPLESSMGHPTGGAALLEYFVGGRYTSPEGTFGLDASRMSTLGSYAWEEFLGVGAFLAIAGLARLAKANRPLLGAIAAWSIPYLAGAVLFRIEGQQDFWYVAAWLPLYPLLALGLQALAARAGARGAWAVGATGLLGLGWAVAANYPDLNQRSYEWAEAYGRFHLKSVDPEGAIVGAADDLTAVCRYLKVVRGERPDVAVLSIESLTQPWYEERIGRLYPGLRVPSIPEALRRAPDRPMDAIAAAFLTANAGGRRPLYLTQPLAQEFWPDGWELEPAGPLWKLVPGGTSRPDPRHMEFPIPAERVAALFRRPRGIMLRRAPGKLDVAFEPYERRVLTALLLARQFLADWHLRKGSLEPAARLYESILRTDPLWRRQHVVLLRLGQCALALGRDAQAEETLRAVVDLSIFPVLRGGALLGLGDLARKKGQAGDARRLYEEAARLDGLPPDLLKEAQSRLQSFR